MSADFFDSNTLLYLASKEEGKATIVERLLDAEPVVSAQVLNEVTNVLRRKLKLDWPRVDRFVEWIVGIASVLPITSETNGSARAIAGRYGFAFYDSVIVASALEASCARLFTEDLQHGQRIGDLTITNPFR